MSSMSSVGETRGLRLDSQVIGKSQPWMVTHRGLEYPGEVIVAESVDPAWGQPLEGDNSFRIVFYKVPRRIPIGQIRDPRIAMAVPRRSVDPVRESLRRELQSIHEAKERYITASDSGTSAVRSSVEEQEASLHEELTRREAFSYSQGRIYTRVGTTIRPADIFGEPSVHTWVDRLVSTVYLGAYPTLPFEYDDFPQSLTPGGIAAVYRGVFQGDHDAADVAAAFSPALGLARREAPAVFDTSGCRVVDIIGDELASRMGEMSTQELLRLLSSEYGLNRSLAALYVLAFVRHARGEVELTAGHSLRNRQGRPFLSDRLSWDLTHEIDFSPMLADLLGTLRAKQSVAWNAALPYASMLVEGLRLSRDDAEIAEQQERLQDALNHLARRLEGSREGMEALATGLQEKAETALTALDRLQILCATPGYQGFHSVVLNSFGSPSALSQALDHYNRLEGLATLVPEITKVRRYLDEMKFGRDHQDLAVKRDSMVGMMGLESLIADPSLWDRVEGGYERLRREYTMAYLSYHARYHHEAIELVTRLERLRPQAEALALFNEVQEFGGPLSPDVPKRFNEMMTSVRTCMASEDEISLEAAPICQACQLSLGEDIPRREAALLVRDLERAMRVYNRRLSSEGVGRIFADPTKEQLDRFINLVQVSDLSALANVLDEEVVEFLRRFVRPG